MLEADYAEQAVQHILALLEEQDWHWTRVPLSSTTHLLQELLPRYNIPGTLSPPPPLLTPLHLPRTVNCQISQFKFK